MGNKKKQENNDRSYFFGGELPLYSGKGSGSSKRNARIELNTKSGFYRKGMCPAPSK
jgi:hypothetical protein